MKSICILTQNHISRNPRVFKEVKLLRELGYSVKILTTWYSSDFLQDDLNLLRDLNVHYQSYADLRPGQPGRLKHRIIFQFFRRIKGYLNIETVHSAGYGSTTLLKQALGEKADLYIVHQEIPTLLAKDLIHKGFAVAFDFEDWYSRDLMTQTRKFRPVKLLEAAEIYALKHGTWCTTTSKALAQKLYQISSGKKPPEVIYNGFSIQERKNLPTYEPKARQPPIKFAWISQTIGPGRGLESFIQNIGETGIPAELHLAGNPRKEYLLHLENTVRTFTNLALHLHPIMPPHQILGWLHHYHVGIACDLSTPESRNLTVTNKILHYLLAGLPVIASNTAGHKEIADACQNTVLIPSHSEELKQTLMEWFDGGVNSIEIQRKAWFDGEKFCWEHESQKLEKLVSEYFNSIS